MAPAQVILLCGGPDVVVEGKRQHLGPPQRRQTSLALAYLLLEGRPVSADELAEAVWPAGPPASWTSGLRRVVSDLRSWLRTGGIDAEVRASHGTYALVVPGDVATDVAIARELRAQIGPTGDLDGEAERMRAVVRQLEAPLLPGHDAPWLQRWRRTLEADLLEALDDLSDLERRAGRTDAAVAAAEQAIAIDHLRESSYRQAMAAHRQAGRIGAALRTYEQCRRTLQEEIGAAPSPSTTTAYQDRRGHHRRPWRRGQRWPGPPRPGVGPCCGRRMA